jgi:foldase protein PrsA
MTKVIVTIVLALLIVVMIFGGLAVFAYSHPEDFGPLTPVLRVLPFPAMIVNGKVVSLNDWQIEYQAWSKLAKETSQTVTDEQIRTDVTNKLTYDILMKAAAKHYKVKVSKADFDVDISQLAPEFKGTKEDFYREMTKMFGWDQDEFNKRIVYYSILSQKVGEALLKDESLWAPALTKANDVYTQVTTGGKDFSAAAKEFSGDTYSAAMGGQLDWAKKGDFVKEFEDAAWALKPGEISQPVKTQFGYHVIKLLDKRTTGKDDAAVEEISASHILIRPTTLQQYLLDKKNNAWVKAFVK